MHRHHGRQARCVGYLILATQLLQAKSIQPGLSSGMADASPSATVCFDDFDCGSVKAEAVREGEIRLRYTVSSRGRLPGVRIGAVGTGGHFDIVTTDLANEVCE